MTTVRTPPAPTTQTPDAWLLARFDRDWQHCSYGTRVYIRAMASVLDDLLMIKRSPPAEDAEGFVDATNHTVAMTITTIDTVTWQWPPESNDDKLMMNICDERPEFVELMTKALDD